MLEGEGDGRGSQVQWRRQGGLARRWGPQPGGRETVGARLGTDGAIGAERPSVVPWTETWLNQAKTGRRGTEMCSGAILAVSGPAAHCSVSYVLLLPFETKEPHLRVRPKECHALPPKRCTRFV